jgi:ubiquinone biosynthesis protein UbiJ
VLVANLERTLNRFVDESTPARHLIRELDGQSLAVELSGLPLRLVLQAEHGRLTIVRDDELIATATIRAAPIDLLKLLGPDALANLKKTRAEISGDLRVADGFADLLKAASPDIEEELSRWIGDIPAHALGETARSFRHWAMSAGHSIEFSLAEFLHEESGMLPTKAEIERYCTAVDTIRDDVERAEQRLTAIERKVVKVRA